MKVSNVLIMVANYYGVGPSVQEAKANLKKVRGSALKARESQVWWVVTKGTYVDGVDGSLRWPQKDATPIEINRINAPNS